MLSGEAIASITDVAIRAEDFYKRAHRLIFEALTGLYAKGEPVDIITTVEELRRRRTLEDAGGALYIHHLVETVGTPASASHYARIVGEHALLRRLISAAGDILQKAYDVPADPAGFADIAEGLVYAAHRGQDKDEIVALSALVHQSMEDLERLHERTGLVGLPTGFRDLDDLLQGLQKSNLVVVAARPGIGKSSFVTNIARNVAVESGKPVAMFSLEMSRMEIGMRLLCAEARVPSDKVRRAMVAAEDWGRIVEAAETLDRAPIWIVDSGNVTILDIRSKARKLAARTEGLGLIIVDYLQLMTSHQRVESRQQEIAEISRSLKLLAKELDIPVIAVSQLNRDPEKRTDKRPQLADLRECVTGDTLVSLTDGRRVPIRQLVGTTPEVWALSSEGRIVAARSDLVWRVGRRQVFEVRLASGRRIRATAKHRLLGFDGWVRVEDLHTDDRLALARRIPATGTENPNVDTVPQPVFERVLAVRAERGITHRQMAGMRGTAYGGSSHFAFSPSREVLGGYAQLLEDEILQTHAAAELFWDRVVEVEPAGEEDVFDLTVPGPASWLADSIVSHNSGAIEQDSDVVMFIHREDVYNRDDPSVKGVADVIVAKHRNGPTDNVRLTFRGDLTQFLNYTSGQ
jgi:replicative DNA helicase